MHQVPLSRGVNPCGLLFLLNFTAFRATLAGAAGARDRSLPGALLADEMAFQTVQVQQFVTDACLTGNRQSDKGAQTAGTNSTSPIK